MKITRIFFLLALTYCLSACDALSGIEHRVTVTAVPSADSVRTALLSVPSLSIAEPAIGEKPNTPDSYTFSFRRPVDHDLAGGILTVKRDAQGDTATIVLESVGYGFTTPLSNVEHDRALFNEVYIALRKVNPGLPPPSQVQEQILGQITRWDRNPQTPGSE